MTFCDCCTVWFEIMWNPLRFNFSLLLCCTAESEDQSSVTAPEKPPEPEYTEVQIRPADPNRGVTASELYIGGNRFKNGKQSRK